MINKSNLRIVDLEGDNLHIELKHEGQTLGSALGIPIQQPSKHVSLELELSADTTVEDRQFVLTCLIKGFLGRLPLRFETPPLEILVHTDPSLGTCLTEALAKFGFKSSGSSNFTLKLNEAELLKLSQIKRQILELRSKSKTLGRGFLVPSGTFDSEGLSALMAEYNDLAWGSTSLAKNSSIHEDEQLVIEQTSNASFRVLEVGAGSGRLTPTIAAQNKEIVATDYIEQILKTLRNNLEELGITNVICLRDDILDTRLPEGTFDRVLFLENGLGALSTPEERRQALTVMARLLSPDGKLLLGLRSLGEGTGDHVMPASQDEGTFFGVYHVFSKAELQSLLPDTLRILEFFDGDVRPAGGHQFFASLERTM